MAYTSFRVFLAALAICSASALAAPVVSGVSGSLVQGNTLTVAGSGFGTKNPAKPYLWAPFDGSSAPSSLGITTSWSGMQSMGYTPNEGYNGSGGLKATDSSGSWTAYVTASGGFAWNTYGQKAYMYRRIKRNFVVVNNTETNPPGDLNWKIVRVWGANFTYPNWYAAIGGSTSMTTEGVADGNGYMDHNGKMDVARGSPNVWQNDEIEWQANSASGSTDGILRYTVDGTLVAFFPHYTYTWRYFRVRETGSADMVTFIPVHGVRANVTFPSSYRYWADDVYLDTTWARVMIGNAPTLAASTHREMQIPTAWSSTSISVSANIASFPGGQTPYLFVVDSNGIASDGFALSGVGGVTYTVTPSSGANGTINPSTPQTVSSGGTIGFTVTPNAGYTASVGGTCGGSLVGTTYTTNAITANCTVAATFADQTAPTAPATLTATTASTTQIDLSWSASTDGVGIIGYNIERCAGASCTSWASVQTTTGTGTTWSNTGLTPSTTYRYRVRALDAATNYSGYSPIASATTTTTVTYIVTGTAGAGGSISPASQTVNSGSTAILTVTPNAGYTASASGCGGSLSGTTYTTGAIASNCSVSATFCKKLSVPASLVATGLTPNPPSNATISFDWADVNSHTDSSALSGDLANYRLHWGTTSGGPYNTASSATSSISVGPTQANITYYARVGAESSLNAVCNSDLSSEISFYADTVPPSLSGLGPSGSLAKDTTSATLSATTSESATCRYGDKGAAWSSRTPFSTTGSTLHSSSIPVWAGLVKQVCTLCRDALGNESSDGCTSFSVNAKPKRWQVN